MPRPSDEVAGVYILLDFFCSMFLLYRDVSWFLGDPGIGTPNLWYSVISFISICQACWVLLAHAKILLGPQATKCSSTARLVASTAGTEAALREIYRWSLEWRQRQQNDQLRRAWKTGMLCKEHAPHPSLIPDLRSHVTILPYSAIFPHWRLIIAITLFFLTMMWLSRTIRPSDHPTIRPSASCCLQLG